MVSEVHEIEVSDPMVAGNTFAAVTMRHGHDHEGTRKRSDYRPSFAFTM